MAELAHNERLQPSLFDRLTDDEPENEQESRQKRVLSPARLRESVRRDLIWLFNTANLASVQNEIGKYPDVVTSVVNFGLPDLTGRTVSSIDRGEVEQALLDAILAFEPRLVRKSVKVKLFAGEGMDHNAMTFSIEALLWAQPLPLRLFLRTSVDLETGNVDVQDLGEQGRVG